VAVQVRRIQDPVRSTDGARVLVDLLWPRGISKERAALQEWCKQVAPSTDLRRWYGHERDRFEEFRRRYLGELEEPERAEALAHLRALAAHGMLTLLTATRDVEISQAAVLADLVRDRPG
jgi:uncharacterized protein YeaO (DUF488 family)